MNHYVYYSFEEWGRGYIGVRSCECGPSEDIHYLGSYVDESFNPENKVILVTAPSREEANDIEILLHDFFEVDVNPHFANRSRARSKGFYRSGPHTKETIQRISKNRKGKGKGPSKLPRQHFQVIGKAGGIKGSRAQKTEDKQKGGIKARDSRLGFFALSEQENREKSRRGSQTTNSLQYRCKVTGKVSTPGGLARWQRARGIDTSLREQVYPEE